MHKRQLFVREARRVGIYCIDQKKHLLATLQTVDENDKRMCRSEECIRLTATMCWREPAEGTATADADQAPLLPQQTSTQVNQKNDQLRNNRLEKRTHSGPNRSPVHEPPGRSFGADRSLSCMICTIYCRPCLSGGICITALPHLVDVLAGWDL